MPKHSTRFTVTMEFSRLNKWGIPSTLKWIIDCIEVFGDPDFAAHYEVMIVMFALQFLEIRHEIGIAILRRRRPKKKTNSSSAMDLSVCL